MANVCDEDKPRGTVPRNVTHASTFITLGEIFHVQPYYCLYSFLLRVVVSQSTNLFPSTFRTLHERVKLYKCVIDNT